MTEDKEIKPVPLLNMTSATPSSGEIFAERERENLKTEAKILPLEGVADVMFKRGTGFTDSIISYLF